LPLLTVESRPWPKSRPLPMDTLLAAEVLRPG
jgi:hypothetical protein